MTAGCQASQTIISPEAIRLTSSPKSPHSARNWPPFFLEMRNFIASSISALFGLPGLATFDRPSVFIARIAWPRAISGSVLRPDLPLYLSSKIAVQVLASSSLRRRRIVADRIVVVDGRHHPQLGLRLVLPDLADDLRAAFPFRVHLGEGVADVLPVLQVRGRDRLDLVGGDDGGQALADHLPAVIVAGAGQDLGLRVGIGRRRADRAADAGGLLEVGEDAVLHRDRQADRAQLLLREIGCRGVGLHRIHEGRAAAEGERRRGDAALQYLSAREVRFCIHRPLILHLSFSAGSSRFGFARVSSVSSVRPAGRHRPRSSGR